MGLQAGAWDEALARDYRNHNHVAGHHTPLEHLVRVPSSPVVPHASGPWVHSFHLEEGLLGAHRDHPVHIRLAEDNLLGHVAQIRAAVDISGSPYCCWSIDNEGEDLAEADHRVHKASVEEDYQTHRDVNHPDANGRNANPARSPPCQCRWVQGAN